MTRGLMIHHETDSPPGIVGHAFDDRGVTLDHVQIADTYAPGPDPLPSLDGYDFVVSMGGVASVTAAAEHAWIRDELAYLAAADAAGVPVLGICYGGQSLAAALGGAVERCPDPELGWYGIDTDVPADIAAGPWLAWHVDRIVLPPEAKELARTSACTHAYRLRRNLGLQFHPELEEHTLERWAAQFADGDQYGLDVSPILRNLAANVAAARTNCRRLIDYFVDDVSSST